MRTLFHLRRYLKLHQKDVEFIAARAGSMARPGDVFLLSGDIGAGKSTFARAFLRSAFSDVEKNLQVPSPTYLLSVGYRHPISKVEYYHMDWYRLEGENAHLSAGRLDLPKVFKSYVSLVEWPERLDKALLPDQYAKIEMHVDDANPDLRHLDVDIRGDDPQRWQDYFPREHEVAKLHPRH